MAGPHRDEWRLRLGGLESRTHASQGEQRTLALALRLGGHQLCAELTGTPPVLLLDDVFSELDESRSSALTAHLTEGQTLITTAGHVPDGVHADRVFHVEAGRVAEHGRGVRMTRGRRPDDDDPVPIGDTLAAVRAELGLPAGDVLSVLDSRWSEIVGDDVAAHAHLLAVRDGVIAVAVDSPPWATQLRFLEATLIERANAVIGRDAVHAITVRVRPESGAK